MCKRTLVTLVREREWEKEQWVNLYTFPANRVPEEWFRRIVRAYLETDSGKRAMRETSFDFNWGDCTTYIPEGFLNRYGVQTVYGDKPHTFSALESLTVVQDEVLCETSKETWWSSWLGWLAYHFDFIGRTEYEIDTSVCTHCRHELIVPDRFIQPLRPAENPEKPYECEVYACKNEASHHVFINMNDWEEETC